MNRYFSSSFSPLFTSQLGRRRCDFSGNNAMSTVIRISALSDLVYVEDIIPANEDPLTYNEPIPYDSASDQLIVNCPICRKQMTIGDMTNHVTKCPVDCEREIQCGIDGCRRMFDISDLQRRRVHVRQVHKPRVTCPIPGCQALLKPCNMSKHVSQVHEKQKGRCAYCEMEMLTDSLRFHEKRCWEKKLRKTAKHSKCVVKSDVFYGERRTQKKIVKCPEISCRCYVKSENIKLHLKVVHKIEDDQEDSGNSSTSSGDQEIFLVED